MQTISGWMIGASIVTTSGLLGVSGISRDMRTLLGSTAASAREAVDLFVYRISRELGSLAAALGGLDTLIFTGGMVNMQERFALVFATRHNGWELHLTSMPIKKIAPGSHTRCREFRYGRYQPTRT